MKEPTPAELNESAMNHFSRGNGIEAARQLQWALIGDPEYAEAWHNRAMVLRALNDPFDALLCIEKAVALAPNVAAYYNTAGVCWASMTQYHNATQEYLEALALDPTLAAAWHNLGYADNMRGEYNEAVIHVREAVKLQPDNPDYHLAFASALLRAGLLYEGFKEYEWRFKSTDAFCRNHPLPELKDVAGCRGLVLYAEQGHGDAIMFMRFATTLKRNHPHMKVYVEVKKPLVYLALTLPDIDGVVQYGSNIPKDATHSLPMMSAPKFCGIETYEDISGAPYLDAGTPYKGPSKFHVGLCWHTGIRPYQPELKAYAESKSIAPHFLSPLFEVPDVHWTSLQIPVTDNSLPLDYSHAYDITDFLDTAKLIMSLDLVVTVDTSVAHLAGALGKTTFLMTPFDNCWRWQGPKHTSPWYNSVHQFRQPSPGDWPSVIENVIKVMHQDWLHR